MVKEQSHIQSFNEIQQKTEASRTASKERHKQVVKEARRNKRLAKAAIFILLVPAAVKGVDTIGEKLDNQAKIESERNAPIREALEVRAQEKAALAEVKQAPLDD